MKKMYVMAAALLTLASCSKNEVENPDVAPVDGAVAIRLSSAVNELQTKAPVVNGSRVQATIITVNSSGEDLSTFDWNGFSPVKVNGSTTEGLANVATGSFTVGGSAADVSLQPQLYYYESDKTFLKGFAPAGEVAGGKVSFAAMDGEQDVMYATATAGQAKPAGSATAFALTFAHQTTQIKFALKKVKSGDGGDGWAADKSISVKSIALQSVQLPKAIALANGQVEWGSAATFSIPGINNTVVPASDPVSAGNPVMINAKADMLVDAVLVIGEAEKSFVNVPVAIEGNAQIGSSHLITLSIVEPATPGEAATLSATAAVTPWTDGKPGSGKLE